MSTHSQQDHFYCCVDFILAQDEIGQIFAYNCFDKNILWELDEANNCTIFVNIMLILIVGELRSDTVIDCRWAAHTLYSEK